MSIWGSIKQGWRIVGWREDFAERFQSSSGGIVIMEGEGARLATAADLERFFAEMLEGRL